MPGEGEEMESPEEEEEEHQFESRKKVQKRVKEANKVAELPDGALSGTGDGQVPEVAVMGNQASMTKESRKILIKRKLETIRRKKVLEKIARAKEERDTLGGKRIMISTEDDTLENDTGKHGDWGQAPRTQGAASKRSAVKFSKSSGQQEPGGNGVGQKASESTKKQTAEQKEFNEALAKIRARKALKEKDLDNLELRDGNGTGTVNNKLLHQLGDLPFDVGADQGTVTTPKSASGGNYADSDTTVRHMVTEANFDMRVDPSVARRIENIRIRREQRVTESKAAPKAEETLNFKKLLENGYSGSKR